MPPKLAHLAVALAVLAPACTSTDPAPPGTSRPPTQWVMPDLLGSKLQDAQDRIQKLTGNPAFITLSHDATGQNRNQVLDSNWKVCSQNLAAGTTFDKNTKIDFGAVKLTENCPG